MSEQPKDQAKDKKDAVASMKASIRDLEARRIEKERLRREKEKQDREEEKPMVKAVEGVEKYGEESSLPGEGKLALEWMKEHWLELLLPPLGVWRAYRGDVTAIIKYVRTDKGLERVSKPLNFNTTIGIIRRRYRNSNLFFGGLLSIGLFLLPFLAKLGYVPYISPWVQSLPLGGDIGSYFVLALAAIVLSNIGRGFGKLVGLIAANLPATPAPSKDNARPGSPRNDPTLGMGMGDIHQHLQDLDPSVSREQAEYEDEEREDHDHEAEGLSSPAESTDSPSSGSDPERSSTPSPSPGSPNPE